MNRTQYYENMKALAREIRKEYGLLSPRVQLSQLRHIYRSFGIRIDLWSKKFRELRGAYLNDEYGPTVVLNKFLPPEPRIFTMAHELKHHLVDRELHLAFCGSSNELEPIEIGAEIFAAELIFPEQDFYNEMSKMGIARGKCRPESLIRLKRSTSTTLSYAGLVKRAVRLGFAATEMFEGVKWKKLEEQLYGEPLYKRILRTKHKLS